MHDDLVTMGSMLETEFVSDREGGISAVKTSSGDWSCETCANNPIATAVATVTATATFAPSIVLLS